MNIAVVGIGSPNGDDRVGWQVIEMLRQEYIGNRQIFLHVAERHNLEWIGQIGRPRVALFIDAVISGAEPGTLFHFRLPATTSGGLAVAGPWQPACSSHAVSLLSAIELVRTIGELNAEVELFGLEIDDYRALPDLSTAVAKQLPQLIQQVRRVLKSHLRE